jgi:aspartate oxidase
VDNPKKRFDYDNNCNDDDYYEGIFVVKKPISLRNEIQELMKQNAGIVREQKRLQNGLKRILELKNEFYSNKDNINIKEFEIDDNNNSENIVLTWQVNIYCRKEGKGVSATAADEMVLFKQNVKEMKGPLADFLKSHVKAAHHRTFE